MRDLHDLLIAGRMLGGSGADEPVLITKNITANGTYSAASDNADGYSAVTVAVPELPVTFVKGIKSVGNSVIITDFVPAYDWITIADIKMGDIITASGGFSYILGAGYAPSGVTTGLYTVSLRNAGTNGMIFAVYSGNAYGDSGGFEISTYNADVIAARNTLVMRRGNAGNQFGAVSVINSTTATRTDVRTSLAIGGLHTFNPDENILIYNTREITFYGVKFCDNTGVTLHDLVPAKSKNTNRAGLYDLVTGKFYPSSSDYDDFITEV